MKPLPGDLIKPLLRILVVLAVGTLLWNATFFIGEAVFGGARSDYSLTRHLFHAVLVSALVVPALLLLSRLLDRRPLPELAPETLRRAARPFLVGALSWLLPAAAAILVLAVTGWAGIAVTAPAIEILSFLPLLILIVFLYEALPEELIFRGYIYRHLSGVTPRLAAVFIQAALFTAWGAAIGAAGSLDRIVMFFAFSIVQGLLRVATGTVWAPIGLHVAFQTTAQLLLNSDSGFFAIADPALLQIIALGIVPFSLVFIIAERFYPEPHGWMQKDDTPADAAGTA